jgi:hypothetical protein
MMGTAAHVHVEQHVPPVPIEFRHWQHKATTAAVQTSIRSTIPEIAESLGDDCSKI